MDVTGERVKKVVAALEGYWKPYDIDGALASDIVRMNSSDQYVAPVVRAQYKALLWARDNWLRQCRVHRFHYAGEKPCQ